MTNTLAYYEDHGLITAVKRFVIPVTHRVQCYKTFNAVIYE
jgi:hypothetical protein